MSNDPQPEPSPRFAIHLAILVGLCLLYPVMVEIGWLPFYRLVMAAAILAIVFTLGGRRSTVTAAALLAAPAIFSQILTLFFPGRATVVASSMTGMVLFAYLTWLFARHVFGPGLVTGNKLAGAVCVYLLIGLLFATLHAAIAAIQPGAYVGPGMGPDDAGLGTGGEFHFIYFSFVTITTLGYGDILPTTPTSETVSWLEAVIGQLFVAITIARLVGLHIAQSRPGD